MGEQAIHTVSTATGGFSIGHFAEFDYAGKAIVGVIETIEPDGSLTLGCGPEGRRVMPAAECRPWGPPLGALPGDLPTEADGRPAFRPGDRVQWVVDGVMNGNGTVRQYPYRDAFIRPTLALVHFDGDPYPLTALIKDLTLIPTDTAGPEAPRGLPRVAVGDVVEDETGTRGTVTEAWAAMAQVAWEDDPGGTVLEYVGDLRPTQSPAGPASSSASPSGTGGLADLLARLEAATLTLTAHTRTLREELESRRRELWDATVVAEYTAEGAGEAWYWKAMVYAEALRYAYQIIVSIDGEELDRQIAAELDSRYGTDRAKGGEPRD